MIAYHVHIRSTDEFKQVGMSEKNDRIEINSVEDHRVWLYFRDKEINVNIQNLCPSV